MGYKRHGSALALVLALLAGVAQQAIAVPDPYDIPVIQSLAGFGAFLGQNERQTLELGLKVVNAPGRIHGRPLRFVYYDNGSSPRTAVQLTSQILPSHRPVILGSSLMATCSAMQPLLTNGPLMYCLAPGIKAPR